MKIRLATTILHPLLHHIFIIMNQKVGVAHGQRAHHSHLLPQEVGSPIYISLFINNQSKI